MSKVRDKVSYLKGLADGMKLNTEKDSNRMIMELIEALGDVADELEELNDAHDELNDYVESINEDLADLEAILYDDEDEEEADGEDEDDTEEDDEWDNMISYACPSCGELYDFDPEEIDFSEECLCPKCGQPLFPESDLEDDEDEEDDIADEKDE